jgi:hypothetical protein
MAVGARNPSNSEGINTDQSETNRHDERSLSRKLMNLTTRSKKRRVTRSLRRPVRTKPRYESDEVRAARRAGGPEDRALYSCMCGYAFKADVTTSVGCPHCGTEQAW